MHFVGWFSTVLGPKSDELASWRNYTATEKARLEFVIIDDGSPKNPAANAIDQLSRQQLNLRLYRITEDIPWNIMGAQVVGSRSKTDVFVVTECFAPFVGGS